MLRLNAAMAAGAAIASPRAAAQAGCVRRDADVFCAACAFVFVLAVALTLHATATMAAMGEQPMHGGWTLTAMWQPMCGQAWLDAAVGFLAAWTAMAIAMMLPTLAPMLLRYRIALLRRGHANADRYVVLAAAGYFFVWVVAGLAVFVLGAALVQALLQYAALARAAPIAAGALVLAAGAVQRSAWKRRRLRDCRRAAACEYGVPAGAAAAGIYGLRLGLHCLRSCANLNAILLVVGMMNPCVLALVTAAILGERLSADGARIAQLSGALAIVVGAFLFARAVATF